MKQKFYLWFNIVFICLCMCAIGIGIYSLSANSINSSGKIAFSAHDVSVTVAGTIVGHAGGDGSDYDAVTSPVDLGYAEFANGIGSFDLGEKYFSNCPGSDKKSEDIIITLTVTNTSDFKITASIGEHIVPNNVSVTESALLKDIEVGGTWVVALTLSITEPVPIIQSTNNIILGMNFAYYYNPYYISEYAGKEWLTTNMGYSIEEYDGTDEIPIEWVAFAVKDEDLSTTQDAYSIQVESGSSAGTWYSLNTTVDWASYDLDTDLKGKTFWFISRYIIGGGYALKENGIASACVTSYDNVPYHESVMHEFFKDEFYKRTNMYDYNNIYRINSRYVVDEETILQEKTLFGTEFNAFFWEPNLSELILLYGGEIPEENSAENIHIGEPTMTVGIGNTTANYEENWSYLIRGAWGFYIRDVGLNYFGAFPKPLIRPAFEINIT